MSCKRNMMQILWRIEYGVASYFKITGDLEYETFHESPLKSLSNYTSLHFVTLS